ncbi:MFS transporter [Salinibacterium sp. dk2585]|uniref:MFS transporter n=1 Tax=unclassified Salinibacterium TaxID=2632331 RepID=UPI0011C25236|nr:MULTISPECIES: MFS transporter [unclassified Salinibacterium]QEE61567.1 MFS transporter [Salinibacterium sp. dk2585]TXK52464.1 MFS transporter [Salinibacterium sp. dk5596]
MDAMAQTVSRRSIATYAVGSLGTGGFGTLPGLVLVYYLTDTLGVAALAAGLVVTLAKIWDVIIDPVIGARSDASLVATGSRRRFMVLGGVALPVFFVLTFAVPAGIGPVASAVWVALAFLLCATAFSLFQVPYIALPAELTAGYDDRTRLLTWRVVVLTLAILLFGAGGPVLRGLGDDPRAGYLLMAVVAGLVIGGGMLLSSRVAPVASPGTAPRTSLGESYRGGLAALRSSQPFRALLATFVLQGLATGLMLAGAQYVATWVLRSEDAVTLLFVALIAPALLLAPVWGRVSRRVGKHGAFVVASVLFSLAALSMLGLLWAPGPWVYLPVAVAGGAYAGMQSLPMAMLPDVISHDERVTGLSRAGIFGGVWTAGETTGMAFGATVLTIVLAVSGYVESVAGVVAVQPDAAIDGIVLSFSVVPAAFMLASLVTLRHYRLRKADTDEPRRSPIVQEAP